MKRLMFWASLVLVASIPGTNLPLEGLGSVHKALGLLVGALWLFTASLRGKLRRPTAMHYLTALFLMWNAASLTWSVDQGLTLERFVRLVESTALVVILWDILRTPEEVGASVIAFILGCYVSIILTFWDYKHGNHLANSEYSPRFAAQSFEANELGILFAIGLAPAWYFAVVRPVRSQILRFLFHIYPFAAALGIILTASRAALLCAAPGYLYMLYHIRKLSTGWRLIFLMCGMVAVVGASQMDLSKQVDRLATIGRSASNDHFSHRLDIWRLGYYAFRNNSLAGVGAGAFPTITANHGMRQGQGYVAHNIMLSVLTELGVVGFCLLVSIVWFLAKSIKRIKRPERAVWVCMFLTWAFGAQTLTAEYLPWSWLIFTLLACAAHGRQTYVAVVEDETPPDRVIADGAPIPAIA